MPKMYFWQWGWNKPPVSLLKQHFRTGTELKATKTDYSDLQVNNITKEISLFHVSRNWGIEEVLER